MINEQDKQRIEKDAITYEDKHPYDSLSSAYYMGATAELERSEKLLEEYREVIRELIPLAKGWVNLRSRDRAHYNPIIQNAESLMSTSKPEKQWKY